MVPASSETPPLAFEAAPISSRVATICPCQDLAKSDDPFNTFPESLFRGEEVDLTDSLSSLSSLSSCTIVNTPCCKLTATNSPCNDGCLPPPAVQVRSQSLDGSRRCLLLCHKRELQKTNGSTQSLDTGREKTVRFGTVRVHTHPLQPQQQQQAVSDDDNDDDDKNHRPPLRELAWDHCESETFALDDYERQVHHTSSSLSPPRQRAAFGEHNDTSNTSPQSSPRKPCRHGSPPQQRGHCVTAVVVAAAGNISRRSRRRRLPATRDARFESSSASPHQQPRKPMRRSSRDETTLLAPFQQQQQQPSKASRTTKGPHPLRLGRKQN